MIDLHCHILPGIDDGAPDWETTLAMARVAATDGIHTVAATPHAIPGGRWNNTASHILSLVDECNQRLRDAEIPLQVLPGVEAFYDASIPERIGRGELLSLGGGGRYLLFELPMSDVPAGTDQLVFELLLRGITPVLAHPERNAVLGAHPDRIIRLIEQGCLMQVNMGSLLGQHGERVQAVAEGLIACRMAHLLASDAHSPNRRPPQLQVASHRVAELADHAMAVDLVEQNPARVLKGEPIQPPVPLPWPVRPKRVGMAGHGGHHRQKPLQRLLNWLGSS